MRDNKPKKGSGCPKATAGLPAKKGTRATNAREWYTRAGTPRIGGNFAVLQNVDPSGIVFPNGMRCDTVHRNVCAVVLPVDEHQAFYQSMVNFYAEIREKNSGAANYGPMDLAAYVQNVRSARAAAAQAAKMLAAAKTTMPGNVDSAAIMSIVAGNDAYATDITTLADLQNELGILFASIEDLPIPPMSVFDRDDYVYRAIHFDSHSKKPSMMSYVPTFIRAWSVSGTAPNRTMSGGLVQSPNSIANACAAIQAILAVLNGNPINAIIRGDMLNAYGAAAVRKDLTPRLSSSLLIAVEDNEIMSQNENASVLGLGDNLSPYSVRCDNILYETTGDVSLELQFGGVTQPNMETRATLAERPILWHGESAPSDADELAITRFDCYVTKVNQVNESFYDFISCDGNIIIDTVFIDGISPAGAITSSDQYGHLNQAAHGLTPAADIMRIAFESKLMDHCPMYIIDGSSPAGYFWDLDYFGMISADDLETFTVWSTKSQYMAPRPRGSLGRVETRA